MTAAAMGVSYSNYFLHDEPGAPPEEKPAAEEEPEMAILEMPRRHARPRQPHEGLGQGPGSQLVRSALVHAGTSLLDRTRILRIDPECQMGKHLRSEFLPEVTPSTSSTPREAQSPCDLGALAQAVAQAAAPGLTVGLQGDRLVEVKTPSTAGGDKEGAYLALLLADSEPPPVLLLQRVASHRWTFAGAGNLAARSRGFAFFVMSLLELQGNVQTDEHGDPLNPQLVNACRSFVSTEGRRGRLGDMYQVLTHFVSNSVVWREWHSYLTASFADPRAAQEAFLVPRLEQVWSRFQRLRAVLISIFGVLDERFVWKHRFPKVGDLLLDHVRKRCFPLELLSRNELFQQATVKDETLKQIKFAFGFS